MVNRLVKDGLEAGFKVCSNCGEFVLKRLSKCPSCNASMKKKVKEKKSPQPKSEEVEGSIFICNNCGAFIGLDAQKCSACGADRNLLTSQIDVSTMIESATSDIEESSPDIFLCNNCGAFLSDNADHCGICGMAFGEEDEEEVEDIQEVEEEIGSGDESPVKDPLEEKKDLFVCKGCGAFVSPGSDICAICKTECDDLSKPLKEVNIEVEAAEEKLSNTGALFLCQSCGAFLGEDSRECAVCGTDPSREEELKHEEGTWEDVKIRHMESEIPEVEERTRKVSAKIGKKISVEIVPKKTKADVIEDCKRLWYKKAVALKKLGRPKEALKSLNNALSLDGEDRKILQEKADIFYEVGRYKQAAKIYTNLLESDPKNISLWNRLGNTLMRLGNQKESLVFYEKALSIDGKNREALINKGYVLLKQERYEEAFECAQMIKA